jgi:hypothetical protein
MKPAIPPWIFPVLLLIPLFVYIHGLAPSVVAGDTGDFLTAGAIWGVAHQPGYPLYTMMVGLAERLPISPVLTSSSEISVPAWRGNLLSAIIALGALAVLFALVRRLTGSPLAGIVGSGALAFSRTFWWHSEIAENDTLTALFLLSMLCISVKWVQDRRPADPYWLALVSGLGIAHHQSLLLFVPAIIFYLIMSKAIRFGRQRVEVMALLLILGFAPFIYLPMVRYRTVDGPVYFPGETVPEGVQAQHTERSPSDYFLRYVGRSVYGEIRKYSYSDLQTESRTNSYDVFGFHVLRLFRDDFNPLLAILALLGITLGANKFIISRRKHQGTDPDNATGFALVILSYLIYFSVVMFYPSGDVLNAPEYNLKAAGPGLMLPLEVLWSIFIGIGFRPIEKAISGTTEKRVASTVFLIAVLALVGMNIVGNQPYSDKSKDTLMHEYCLNVLNSCPSFAHLIVAGDEIYAFEYMNYVHPEPSTGMPGIRPDLKLEAWGSSLESYSELADINKAMTDAVVRASNDPPGLEIDTTYFNSGFLDNESLQQYTLSRRGIVFAFVPPRENEGLIDTPEQLRDQTGIKSYLPGMPDRYIWTYWGGNLLEPGTSATTSNWRELWAPDEDIRWRIGEMLLFYGTASLLSGDRDKARAYFNQCALVEPENNDVRQYLTDLAD